MSWAQAAEEATPILLPIPDPKTSLSRSRTQNRRRRKVWIGAYVVKDEAEVKDVRIALFTREDRANAWLERERDNFESRYSSTSSMVNEQVRPFYLNL